MSAQGFDGDTIDTDGAGFYDEYESAGAQLTPEIIAEAAQLVQQAQAQAEGEAHAQLQASTGLDPVQQEHADALYAARPELWDPKSHEAQAFEEILQERATQAGMPEAVRHIGFMRAVHDSLPKTALMTPLERFGHDVIDHGGQLKSKVLPFG
jgi:hypothetical protein